jgi:hypothetical protein
MANNTGPDLNVLHCVDKNRNRLSACAFDPARQEADAAFQTQLRAVAGQTKVKMVDLFDYICPTVKCPAVIGNVLIYRLGSHITATYVKTLTPHLAKELSTAGLPAQFTPTF